MTITATIRPKSRIVTDEKARQLSKEKRERHLLWGCKWFHKWKTNSGGRECQRCGEVQFIRYEG